jgi:adenylosuccinate synthase
MVVDVVIGAQRGDEGKGNFCAKLGLDGDYTIAVRSASPQAGHSIHLDGKRVGIAHLPCAAVNPNLRLLLGAASFIDPQKIFYGGQEIRPHTGEIIELQPEIPTFGLTPKRLGIDKCAKLVTKEHKEAERTSSLMKLGSIGSGVNSAKHDLIDKKAKFITEDPELAKYATDTVEEMNAALSRGGIELCQHFGGYFPYNTARTINTSAYLGEIGLPPQVIRDVYLVVKPYTTACAKDAPLIGEITDEQTLDELLHTGGESGSISGRIRRAGIFDWNSFRRAIMLSGATKLCASHLDLSPHAWRTVGFSGEQEFLERLQEAIQETRYKPRLALVSHGPRIEDITRAA